MHVHDKPHGWIGVDFDGTLAHYDGWKGAAHCGEPIAPMVERVKRWLDAGWEVRIFTARVFPFYRPILPRESLMTRLADDDFDRVEFNRAQEAAQAATAIREWCEKHIGLQLPITCVKDYAMAELWDDRAVQVRANTGEPVGESTRGL